MVRNTNLDDYYHDTFAGVDSTMEVIDAYEKIVKSEDEDNIVDANDLEEIMYTPSKLTCQLKRTMTASI